MASPFAGSWHYRSFRNDPTPTPPEDPGGADWSKLYFAEGDFTFDDAPLGQFEGSADFGDGYTMAFHGNSGLGSPMQIRFQGVGTGANNKDWDYDYIAYYIPVWPNSVNQVDAMVGSIVRSKPHASGSGIAPAGVTATFILLRNPVKKP